MYGGARHRCDRVGFVCTRIRRVGRTTRPRRVCLLRCPCCAGVSRLDRHGGRSSRTSTGEPVRVPESAAITQVVGELATRRAEFRTRWAAHNVTAHRHDTKRFCRVRRPHTDL
nr:hypothetical protein [Mycobacterium neglectum]